MIRPNRFALVVTIGLALGANRASADYNLYSTDTYSGVVSRTSMNGTTTVYAPIPNSLEGNSLTFDQSGNLYVLSQGEIYKASPGSQTLGLFCNVSDLTYSGGQGGGSQIVADSSGNLFLTSDQGIFEVSPSGHLNSTPFSAMYSGGQIAFDSQGNLYATILYGLDAISGKIEKFSPTGQDLGTFTDLGYTPAIGGLAFDKFGDLLVSSGGRIREFSSTGQDLGNFADNILVGGAPGVLESLAFAPSGILDVVAVNRLGGYIEQFSSSGTYLGALTSVSTGTSDLAYNPAEVGVVPEPSSCLLLGLGGLMAFGVWRSRARIRIAG